MEHIMAFSTTMTLALYGAALYFMSMQMTGMFPH
jgi:hypothetical protein